ncbi:MAG: YebC/PmpR family DNA-binding transcriptional regulator [Anaerolineae bacterium]
MSGHSKWSTIKHRKGAADARRGKLFTKLARAITVAAREGGADLESNFALRLAVDKAKGANMPKDNIARAIDRGTGAGKGGVLEHIVYEGYGPHGTAVLISTVTDNRNRTVGEVRNLFSRHGCSLGEAGSVAWQFNQRGVLTVEACAADPDEVALLAIDAGAIDVDTDDDDVTIYTEVSDFQRVKEQMGEAGVEFARGELAMIPAVELALDPKPTLQVMRFLDALEELDDVDNVWSNVSISTAVAAEFAAA